MFIYKKKKTVPNKIFFFIQNAHFINAYEYCQHKLKTKFKFTSKTKNKHNFFFFIKFTGALKSQYRKNIYVKIAQF